MAPSIATGYASKVSEYVAGRPEYPSALLSDEVRIGSAELIPAPDRVAGLVCCATAFIRAKVESIVESDPLLSGRDAIEFPYVTELHLFGKQG